MNRRKSNFFGLRRFIAELFLKLLVKETGPNKKRLHPQFLNQRALSAPKYKLN
jgi:hypothetical protein